LSKTTSGIEQAMERLSTGLRINSAKDDAAGLGISDRMTTQIRGLNQAIRNAGDAISLSQTAEGAMQESTNILQRMRELAVQSANGTNSAEDRNALQAEVDQLKAELTRIADTTTFNGKKLFDGSFGTQSFQVGYQANETISVTIGDARAATLGSYTMVADGSITGNVVTGAAANGVSEVTNMTITTGAGTSTAISYADDASAADIATAINASAASVGITATASNSTTLAVLENADGDGLSFTLNGATVSASITTSSDLSELAAAINGVAGTSGVTAVFENPADKSTLTLTTTDGRDINLQSFTDDDASSDGTAATIELGGTELESGAVNNDGIKVGTVSLTSSEGAFTVANASTEVFASANPNSSFSAVANVDISGSTDAGAQAALSVLDSALRTISTLRSDLGAVQNRMEYTISNLNNVVENTSAARSRVMDADFAAETANLTRGQILQQAGVSMLAQANAAPQAVLALLQ
jgi:flagellin